MNDTFLNLLFWLDQRAGVTHLSVEINVQENPKQHYFSSWK